MKNKNYNIFRQNYEKNISKKLEINKEEFDFDYYETKQPIGLTIFGGLLLLYGLYIMFKIHTIYGLLIIISSLFFIYGGLKKPKLVFRISKNGVWTKEFGLIYFRHIERFEFYRYIGKHSSERLKIYIKNSLLLMSIKYISLFDPKPTTPSPLKENVLCRYQFGENAKHLIGLSSLAIM